MRASQIHELTRKITVAVHQKFDCYLTIGIYVQNTKGEFAGMKEALKKVVLDHPEVLQVHGFYVDTETKTCYFDLVVDFDHDAEKTSSEVIAAMKRQYPAFSFATVLDHDISG